MDRATAPVNTRADRNTAGRRWYVVMTHPRCEDSAATHLRRQGFETFVPRRWVTKRGARGFRRVLEPVFTRYVFVSLDLAVDRWRSINGTYCVSRIVAFGDRPTPVPSEVAETFRLSTAPDGGLLFADALHPGDSVRLVAGPFAEQLGILERLDRQDRVRLLIDVLGGQVRLWTSRADLERHVQSRLRPEGATGPALES